MNDKLREIKRFEHDEISHYRRYSDVPEFKDGEWVKFEDVEKLLNTPKHETVEETTESLVRNLLTPVRFYLDTGENKKQADECIREIDRVCGKPEIEG